MGINGVKYVKIISCVYLISVGVLLGGTSTKNIVASRCDEPPKLDGLLNEHVWKSAIPVSGFQQYDPEEGAPATEGTSVRILYDDNALYIGVFCYDSSPSEIVKQLTRRDRLVQGDRFSVIIDSYHDHTTAFLFSGSVSGVQSDGVLSQDGLIYDIQWDAVWDFEAKVLSEGWSAEFKIPFSVLRFSEQEGEYVWGINFRRYIARKKETVEWVMVPRKETSPLTISSVSKMGNLSGIINIQRPLHIEILPYHVSKVNYLSQPKPFRTEGEYDPKNFGLDLKYGVTPDLTVDLAVNPDFGQVEVDQAELNLTVFETLYPEKRPFFLEGSQIFSFGNSFDREQMRLLYSRRIGRQPTGYENLSNYISSDGETLMVGGNARFSKKPEITTILAAGKFSGRISQNLQFGILSAVTTREDAIIEGIGKESPPIMVEPRANYNVLRLNQNIYGTSSYSSVGFMATSTFKHQQTSAFSGGVDWSSRLMGGEYGIDGYIAGSHTKPNLGRELSGSAGRLGVGKLGGEHWLAFSGYDFSSENFSINDLGYYSQPREHGGYLQISYKDDHASAPFYRYGLTGQTNYRWNWNGKRTLNRIEFEPAFEFRNFWFLTFNFFHEFPAFDDKNKLSYGEYVPPVNLYKRPQSERFLATLHTDSRKSFMVTLQSGYNYYVNGARTYFGVMQTTIKPLSWMDFVPGFTFMKTKNEEAWLVGGYTDDGFCLFGDRKVDYYNFSLKGTITFTPKIGVQFFSQVFLLKLRYTNFKKLIGPENLPSLSDYPTNIDYFSKVFNANIVFRWEYLPGSTFFLVWTQARNGQDGVYSQPIIRDFWDTFRIPMDNVILAKISYWWSL